jgi:hypothetical protein
MLRRSWSVRSLAQATLVAGLWFVGSGSGFAQQTVLGTLSDPAGPVEQAPSQPKPMAPAQPSVIHEGAEAPKDGKDAPDGGAACPDGKPKEDKPKEPPPFWTKVPDLAPLPRTGNFFFFPAPEGPGYYSLLDVVTGNYREKPPKNPWPPVSPDFFPFYVADFRYLDDPKNTQHDCIFDCTKRIHWPNCDWMFSVGGEERIRYMNEVNSRLTGKFDDYTLERTRVYGDLWYKDLLRVYVEFLDARSNGQDLAPQPIDVDHADLLNAFIDLKLGEIDNHPVYARGGRQELYYGSQRLVSPLDWANTRRTFEGFKIFWHSDKLDVDGWWTRPVTVFPGRFDAGDENRQFAGFWSTYRPNKSQAVDLYYLYLDNLNHVVAKPGPNGRGGQDVNTFGARYVGDYEKKLLWDFEGMWQFGDRTTFSISAGAATAGIGWHFADVPMNPSFWIYNDFASGSDNGVNQGGTFNTLFPFNHFYLGFIDLVGRQNIEDPNLQLYFFPTNWITCNLQGHFFYLDSGKDALYNKAGVVERSAPKGNAGKHVGDEVDWLTNFHLGNHSDILVGYSILFSGEFIRKTAPNPAAAGNSQLIYVQYSFKW